MSSEDRFWLGFWVCVMLTIVGIAWAVAYAKTAVEIEAIRAGLTQIEYDSNTKQTTKLKWVQRSDP